MEDAVVIRRNANTDLESDAVWGAAPIGKILGANPRRAHYLLSTGALKGTGVRLVGGRWLASRRKLMAFIEGNDVNA